MQHCLIPYLSKGQVSFDIWLLTLVLWSFASFIGFDLYWYSMNFVEIPKYNNICKILTFDLWLWSGDLGFYVFSRSCLGHYAATINDRRFILEVWHIKVVVYMIVILQISSVTLRHLILESSSLWWSRFLIACNLFFTATNLTFLTDPVRAITQ